MGNSRSCHNEYILREMPHRVRELHVAVKSNDRDAVRTLVAQGVNINFPFFNPSNPSIKDGNTPLIIAVSLNYTEIVEASVLVCNTTIVDLRLLIRLWARSSFVLIWVPQILTVNM